MEESLVSLFAVFCDVFNSNAAEGDEKMTAIYMKEYINGLGYEEIGVSNAFFVLPFFSYS